MAYAKELTRKMLEEMGVKTVSFDGTEIWVTNRFKTHKKKLTKSKKDDYLRITIQGKSYAVQRIVYAWFHEEGIPAGMVVDHIDNNKRNNHIYNLQLLTPEQNLAKNKPNFKKRIMKCKLNVPRYKYEEDWERYNQLYQMAKINKNKNVAHYMRTCRSNVEARLRYYDLMTVNTNHEVDEETINKMYEYFKK